MWASNFVLANRREWKKGKRERERSEKETDLRMKWTPFVNDNETQVKFEVAPAARVVLPKPNSLSFSHFLVHNRHASNMKIYTQEERKKRQNTHIQTPKRRPQPLCYILLSFSRTIFVNGGRKWMREREREKTLSKGNVILPARKCERNRKRERKRKETLLLV